jgi:hypothetical protein
MKFCGDESVSYLATILESISNQFYGDEVEITNQAGV